MSKRNLNLNWSYQIANILAEKGIRRVCLCPGSRNTPLTIAFTNSEKFICTSHVDERSAAYFALGISKKELTPSVLLSTSGTATANFFPAIIESSLSKVPLIVITADRPLHLINTGENQTINQHNIYGEYTRCFYDLGLPKEKVDSMNNKILSIYSHTLGCDKNPPGPSHINVPFDEPIIHEIFGGTSINTIEDEPHVFNSKELNLDTLDFEDSMIICGNNQQDELSEYIIKFSEHINAPILADPTSGLRYRLEHENIISNYNLFVDDLNVNPKTIIRFGSKPTSKSLCKLISRHHNVTFIDRYSTFNDDSKNQIDVEPIKFIKTVIESTEPIQKNKLLELMISVQNKISVFINNIDIDENRCEAMLIHKILEYAEPNSNIFIGNSMAIREMDDISLNINKNINIFCNRGASGIDGLVSTALGVAHASEKNSNNIAILGDLSFYHDMNGLLAAKKNNLNMKFIILNNNGGGIFSGLNTLNLDYNKFEEYWTTPHNLELKNISNLYNLRHTVLNNIDDIKDYLVKNEETEVIEFKIDIKESLDIKNKIKDRIKKLF